MPRMKAGMSKHGAGIQYRFYVDGKRYAVSGKTTAECLEKAAEKRRMIEQGVSLKDSNPTLAEYFTEWEARRKGTITIATEMNTRCRITPVLKKLGNTKLKKITRRQVMTMAADMAKHRNYTSVKIAVSILKAVMLSAVDDEIIERSPVYRITFPALVKKAPARETNHRALTEEEVHDFLEAAKGSYYYDAICLQLNTGMRVGEVLGLLWQDIDWKAGVIHIRRTVTRISKGRHILGKTTKTSAGARNFPINAPIREILERRRKYTNAFDKKAMIFPSAAGGVASGVVVDSVIKWVTNKANAKRAEEGREPIKHFSSHALRATFVSMAARQGVPLNTIKELVGHKDINLTASLYGHVYDDAKKEAMADFSITGTKDKDKEEAAND